MKVGWIGLGSMGLPMARNAIKAGHALTLYNRTGSRAAQLEEFGARVVKTPAEAASAECVVTMVSDDEAVRGVTFGAGGILASLPRGGTHVCMATISVALAQDLQRAHQAAGQTYVSAPVFGRPDMAAAAKLFIVAAGPREPVQRLDPLFTAIGQRTYSLGENPTAANVVKLSGNFLIASTIECLGEAFALVRKYNVDPQQFSEVITTSLFSAPVYKGYGSLIASEKYEPVGFRMELGLKDMRLVLGAADAAAVPMPTASLVRDSLLSGVARGFGDADWANLARFIAENAGIKSTKET
ncbi:MAG: NAD(P)-dependent oxidoreductase [Terriglobia bacterium]